MVLFWVLLTTYGRNVHIHGTKEHLDVHDQSAAQSIRSTDA